MDERLINIYTDIMNDDNVEQIKEYFEKRCYLTTPDFGKLVAYFVENITDDKIHILDIIFHSAKFKEKNTCCDRFGEPILHCILYAIAAKKNKDYYIGLLFDKTIPWNWMMYSGSIENSLHIIASLCDTYGMELTKALVELALENEVCPLDRNDANINPMEIFRYDHVEDGLTEDERLEIVNILEDSLDYFLIELQSDIYDEVETEVEVEETEVAVCS